MYRITYIVKNYVNDIQEYTTIQEVYGAIKDCVYDCDVSSSLSDFYDEHINEYAADLIELEHDGKMVVPFENDDNDYGAMIIERV